MIKRLQILLLTIIHSNIMVLSNHQTNYEPTHEQGLMPS